MLPPGSRIVRATIQQDDIDLVRNRLRSTSVKLAERLDETLPARIIREVPAGRDDLPSKALGGPGGGALCRSIRATRKAPRHYSACFRWTSSCRPMSPPRPRSAVAPTCASTMSGSRRAGRFGGACGSSSCPGFRSEVAACCSRADGDKSSMLPHCGRCALSGASRPQGKPARRRIAQRLGPRFSLFAVRHSSAAGSSASCGGSRMRNRSSSI